MKISGMAVWMAAAVWGAAALAGRGHALKAREGDGDVERLLREEWGFQCGTPDAEAWEAAVAKEEEKQAAREVQDEKAAKEKRRGKNENKVLLKAGWRGQKWPKGWDSVDRGAWTFGGGEARQTKAEMNVHRQLFYEPGMEWRDYEVTVRFESDRWYMPPSRSSAGVWVRSQGGEEGYFIDLCGAGDMAVVSFEEGKKIREIKRVPVAVETVRDGKPWTVRVRGDEIMVEHEGRCFLKVRDSKFPVGTVGVEGIHVPMAFSGLEVRQLDTTSGRYAGTRCGRKRPGRVFPEWKPEDAAADSGAGLEAELRALVVQGRRDRAASPEFLDALEGVLDRHAGEGEKASDQLPLKPAFRGPGMPAGWRAVEPSVWRFGDGEARQVESKANTRYVLYYEPGMAWRDYAVTLRFESDGWFPPPANSCAAVWVRYKGVDDAYCVHFDGNGNVSVISCERGGKGRVIVRTAAGAEVIKDGKPWMVRVRGEEIVVEHEGRRYLEVHDGTHREGTVGLESIHIPMAFSGMEVK